MDKQRGFGSEKNRDGPKKVVRNWREYPLPKFEENPVFFKQNIRDFQREDEDYDVDNTFHCAVMIDGLPEKKIWVSGGDTLGDMQVKLDAALASDGLVSVSFSLPDGTDLPIATLLAVVLNASPDDTTARLVCHAAPVA